MICQNEEDYFVKTKEGCLWRVSPEAYKSFKEGKKTFSWSGDCYEGRINGYGKIKVYLNESKGQEPVLIYEIDAEVIMGYPRHYYIKHLKDEGRESEIYHFPGDWVDNPDEKWSTSGDGYVDKLIHKVVGTNSVVEWQSNGLDLDPDGIFKQNEGNYNFWARIKKYDSFAEAWIGNIGDGSNFFNYDSVSSDIYLITFSDLERLLRRRHELREFLDGIVPFEEYKSPIAILEFQNTSKIKELDPLVEGYRNIMTSELSSDPDSPFKILERAKIDEIYKELELNQSDYIDEKTAQKMGKGIGAKYILSGSFLDFEDQFRIDTRLLEVESGEVIISKGINGQLDDFLEIADSTAKILNRYIYKNTAENYDLKPKFNDYYDRKTFLGRVSLYESCESDGIIDTICTGNALKVARKLKNQWNLYSIKMLAEEYIHALKMHNFFGIYKQYRSDPDLIIDIVEKMIEDNSFNPAKIEYRGMENDRDFIYMAALLCTGQGNRDRFKEILKYGLKYFPNDLQLLELSGDQEKIIYGAKEKLRDEPKNTIMINTIAKSYKKLGEHDSAAVYYEQYFKYGGTNDANQKGELGICLFYAKRYWDAIKYLEENDTTGATPNALAQTNRYIGLSYASLNSWQKASEYQRKYIMILERNFPENDEFLKYAYVNLAEYDKQLGNLEKMKISLDKGLEIDNQFDFAYNNLCEYYMIKKDYDKALKAIEKAIRIAPELPNYFDTMGDLQLVMGNEDDALNYYFKGIQIDSTFSQGFYHIAVVYENQKNTDYIEYYQKAAEFGDVDAELWVMRNKKLIDEHNNKGKAAPAGDYIEELKKLAELKSLGIITEEEFEAKKKELLGL